MMTGSELIIDGGRAAMQILGRPFLALLLSFLGFVPKGATFVRIWIFHQAVDGTTFVVFREVFGDG